MIANRHYPRNRCIPMSNVQTSSLCYLLRTLTYSFSANSHSYLFCVIKRETQNVIAHWSSDIIRNIAYFRKAVKIYQSICRCSPPSLPPQNETANSSPNLKPPLPPNETANSSPNLELFQFQVKVTFWFWQMYPPWDQKRIFYPKLNLS